MNSSITDKEFQKAMQKLKERGNNAVPPKKSASAYIIFGKEKRNEILKRNPQAKVTEVVKEMAQCWRQLDKEDRISYKEQARRDKERYDKELKSLESLSETLKKPKKCLSAYMIFVKETRPSIVEKHPDMGALQIMQEVGKQWQAMLDEERQYFKDKADKDKIRYLAEQKKFYDEVEKIGQQVGTTTTNEGLIVVQSQSQSSQPEQIKMNKKQKSLRSIQSQQINIQEIPINKRKPIQLLELGNLPNKRLKLEESEKIIPSNNSCFINLGKITIQNNGQQSLQVEDRPRKPLSAYIYFSQEFRDILRVQYPQLTANQITKAVGIKWQSLSKEQKQPFEQIAAEDKVRYDKETIDFKKGIFLGRTYGTTVRMQSNQKLTDSLKISEDIIQFLSGQSKVDDIQDHQFEDEQMNLEYEEEHNLNQQKIQEDNISAEQDKNQQQQNNDFEQPLKKISQSQMPINDKFKVTLENFEEARARKDSLTSFMNNQGFRIENEEQQHDIINPFEKNQYSNYGMFQNPTQQKLLLNQGNNSFCNQSYLQSLPNQDILSSQLQLPTISQNAGKIYNFFQNSLSPFCFNGLNANYSLQNELQDREYERKTSMSFPQFTPGMGPVRTTNQNTAGQMMSSVGNGGNILQSPAFFAASPLLGGIPFNPYQQSTDDENCFRHLLAQGMGASPFYLPPSRTQQMSIQQPQLVQVQPSTQSNNQTTQNNTQQVLLNIPSVQPQTNNNNGNLQCANTPRFN